MWMDPPAAVGARASLVHDLHLALVDPQNNVFYGNNLKTTTETHPSHDVIDVVNNVEQVGTCVF